MPKPTGFRRKYGRGPCGWWWSTRPIIEKDGEIYAALCPKLDVASQGSTVEETTANLREAVELFLECADPEEVKRRLRTESL